MKTMVLSVNTILKGVWYNAGQPIEESLVPPNIRQYAVKPKESRTTHDRNLMLRFNQHYSYDQNGYLKPSVARQAAQLEADTYAEEAITDELAEGKVNETLASAIEEAQANHRADVERQKAQARVKARQQEEADEALRQEQNASVESGEFDQWDAQGRREEAVDSEEPAPRASASSKLKVKGKRSFVRRGRRFVLAKTVEDLIEGEVLYRHRPKSFGVAEKYIAFGKVRKETSNEV